MASRYGSRPNGSDGSDFQHRERVIEPYNQRFDYFVDHALGIQPAFQEATTCDIYFAHCIVVPGRC